MAQEISQSRASVLLATSHSNSIVHAIPGYPASSPGNTRAQHACCAVSFWWFHLRRWLLGGNTYAQLLGSSQRLNGHHTARGGVSNIEPLTRVQEETRV